MNHRSNSHRFCTVLASLAAPCLTSLCLALSAAPALAQTTAPTTAPVKRGKAPDLTIQQANPLTPAQVAAVKAFVTTEMSALATDPSVGPSVRKTLETAASIPGKAANTSTAYQIEFANALNAEVLTQLKSGDNRVRLGAAVTLARVAIKLEQDRLSPAVSAALSDKSEPVVMWGVKASKHVYPYLITAGNQRGADALADKIVGAVRAYPTSSVILEDAWDALLGDLVASPGNARRAGGVNGAINLLQARAQLFIPVQPGLPETVPGFPVWTGMESRAPYPNAPVFLAFQMWPTMTPAQQASAGRALFDLADEMVRLAPLVPARAQGEPLDVTRQKDMMDFLSTVIAAIQVAGKNTPGADAVVATCDQFRVLLKGQPNQPGMQALLPQLEAAMSASKMLAARPVPPAPAENVAPAVPGPVTPKTTPVVAPVAPVVPKPAPQVAPNRQPGLGNPKKGAAAPK